MNTYIAKTLQGFEPLLTEELIALGATNLVTLKRGVQFEGDKRLLYKANLWLRTAIRILVPINQFDAFNEEELYNGIKAMDWSEHLSEGDTIAIDSTVFSERFTHSHYISLKTKDAICDQFRERKGKRPNVDLELPTLRVHIYINQTSVGVYLDSSGTPLFKRGYRANHHEAPINEVLAAGLLLHSGWKGEGHFLDPFCGSGTFLIEAAMIAYNIAPGRLRYSFGFHTWRDFDDTLWQDVRLEANRAIRPYKGRIEGSDWSENAVAMAEENIERARLTDKIEVTEMDFRRIPKRHGSGMVVTNPPYGERMQTDTDILDFYVKIGDLFKQCLQGYRCALISSHKEALRGFGLRPTQKIACMNGKLECEFAIYDIYAGTKRVFTEEMQAEHDKNAENKAKLEAEKAEKTADIEKEAFYTKKEAVSTENDAIANEMKDFFSKNADVSDENTENTVENTEIVIENIAENAAIENDATVFTEKPFSNKKKIDTREEDEIYNEMKNFFSQNAGNTDENEDDTDNDDSTDVENNATIIIENVPVEAAIAEIVATPSEIVEVAEPAIIAETVAEIVKMPNEIVEISVEIAEPAVKKTRTKKVVEAAETVETTEPIAKKTRAKKVVEAAEVTVPVVKKTRAKKSDSIDTSGIELILE